MGFVTEILGNILFLVLLWIPAFSGMTIGVVGLFLKRISGCWIHRDCFSGFVLLWIPACAGMTKCVVELGFGYWLWILAFAGMTGFVGWW